MMNRITIMNILLLAFSQGATAQTPWTMDCCMAYAAEHATTVQTRRVEMQQAETDYRWAKADFLPQVGAQVSGQYSWGRNIDPETNTYNNVTTFNNYYELYAQLPVFDGFATLNGFKRARLARSNSETALQQARDEQAITVMQRFIDAVYAQKTIALAEEKLADSQQLLHKTQRLFDLGEKSRPDVAQIAAQVAEDQYNLTHQQNTYHQAMLALKAAMNYPVGDSLSLAIDLPHTTMPVSDTASSATNFVSCTATPRVAASADALYGEFSLSSPELRLAENAVSDARYAYRIERAELLPKLRFTAEVATNFYRNITEGGSPSFSSQWSNNRGEYLVLALSIPIFNASSWNSVKRAKGDIAKAQIALEEKRRKLHDDIQSAIMDRDGYQAELLQMEHKVEADSLASYLSHRKYEEGMLSTFDLHTAAQTLLESRIKRLQTSLLLVMKQRLVSYYQGHELYRKME